MKNIVKTAFKFLCIAAMLALSAAAFCACGATENATASQVDGGFTVVGQISSDEGVLANVGVRKNGEDFLPSVATNAFGIFTATGLKENDVLNFYRYGYDFSPSSFTVTESVNDLRILASATDSDASGGNGDGSNDDDNEIIYVSVSLLTQNSGLVTDFSGNYASGSTVSLSASETDGWRFDGWFADGTLIEGGKNTEASYTVSKTIEIEARFTQIPCSPALSWNEATSTLSWNSVENADSYRVYAGTSELLETSDTAVCLYDYLDAGENFVSVEAVGNTDLNGEISRRSALTVACYKKILSAKNIGFLQNDDEKALVFSFTDEFVNSFDLTVEKDGANFSCKILLQDFAVSNHAEFKAVLSDNSNYCVGFSAQLSESTLGEQKYYVCKVALNGLFENEISTLIQNYAQYKASGTIATALENIKSECGEYVFSVSACSDNPYVISSNACSASFEYKKQLASAFELAVSGNILSFKCDDFQKLCLSDFSFEILLNDVKIATVLQNSLLIAQSDEFSSYSVDLSKYTSTPVYAMISGSVIVTAENYYDSEVTTFYVVP